MANNDPDLANALADFKRGGWIVSLFGGAGMLARMLLTDQNSTIIVWIRKTLAGSIIGVLAYFAIWGQPISGIYKAIILSVSGAISPELLERAILTAKGYKNNERRTPKKRK